MYKGSVQNVDRQTTECMLTSCINPKTIDTIAIRSPYSLVQNSHHYNYACTPFTDFPGLRAELTNSAAVEHVYCLFPRWAKWSIWGPQIDKKAWSSIFVPSFPPFPFPSRPIPLTLPRSIPGNGNRVKRNGNEMGCENTFSAFFSFATFTFVARVIVCYWVSCGRKLRWWNGECFELPVLTVLRPEHCPCFGWAALFRLLALIEGSWWWDRIGRVQHVRLMPSAMVSMSRVGCSVTNVHCTGKHE